MSSRDPKRTHTQVITMRMAYDHIRELDVLSRINKRTRRQIVELLIHEAALALRADPTNRLVPS